MSAQSGLLENGVTRGVSSESEFEGPDSPNV